MTQGNPLKQALARNQRQLGLWCCLSNNVSAEVVAGSGFDWLLIDGEHSPNDLRSVLAQLQAIAPYPSEPIVRVPHADAVLIKQFLDVGARSLLLPNINSAQQASDVVSATRYPPRGIRGVSVLSRANRFGRVPGYHANAERDICVIVQIESPEAVQAAADIAAVDGVDALFVGPSDLSTTMGYMLKPRQPEVQTAIASVVSVARDHGKAAGILATVEADAQRYLDMGYTLVGVGSDVGLLAAGGDNLIKRFRPA